MKDISPGNVARLDHLARQAIELYGTEAQFNMAIEETSELLNELAKIHRNRQNWENILEEAVDTYIMMTEIFIIFGPDEVNAMFERKLDKFAGNLKRSIEKRKERAEREEIIRKAGEKMKYESTNIVQLNLHNYNTGYNGA